MQVKQISDNEIYLLIKYIKSVLWIVAKRLSYIEDARCLKVKTAAFVRALVTGVTAGRPSFYPRSMHVDLAVDKMAMGKIFQLQSCMKRTIPLFTQLSLVLQNFTSCYRF